MEIEPVSPNEMEGWPEGWDEPRKLNLMQFANSTPQQKLEWLGHMFELFAAIHSNR